MEEDFVTFLVQLPAIQLDRLYESRWTCQAVLRSLPPLAKQYVLRLAFADSVPQALFQGWHTAEGQAKHKGAIDKLRQLRVLQRVGKQTDRGITDAKFRLNPLFKEQIQKALAMPIESVDTCGVQLEGGPSVEELRKYAVDRWEEILLCVIGTNANSSWAHRGRAPAWNSSKTKSLDVLELFKKADLVSKCTQKSVIESEALQDDDGGGRGQRGVGKSDGFQVTEKGFQFLLMDEGRQLWSVVREYVATAESRDRDLASILGFLLQLGFQRPERAYRFDSLPPLRQQVVEELAELGIIYLHTHSEGQAALPTKRSAHATWYYPTRLSRTLSGAVSGEQANLANSMDSDGEALNGYVLVETNYRLYAYTASTVQIAIMELFTRPQYRLPNLFVGVLTRESVAAALDCGIDGEQIISFLQQHAHPDIANRIPIVPETVADQIRLWAAERNRVVSSNVVLYENFPSDEDFQSVVQFSRSKKYLVWMDSEQRKMAVHLHGDGEMRQFIRQNVKK